MKRIKWSILQGRLEYFNYTIGIKTLYLHLFKKINHAKNNIN